MIWLVLGLLLAGVVGVVIHMRLDSPPAQSPLDPEEAAQAAVELHRLSRRLDVAQLKAEQRRAASQMRRDIAESLKNEADL